MSDDYFLRNRSVQRDPHWLDGYPTRERDPAEVPRRGCRLVGESGGCPAHGAVGKTRPVAGLVAYLLSPESGVMTGALVDYDQHVAGAYPE